MQKSIFNFCPETIRVRGSNPDFPAEEFQSDGVWQCTVAESEIVDPILGVPTVTPGRQKLGSLPFDLPNDRRLLVIVPEVMGRAIERATDKELGTLFPPQSVLHVPACFGYDPRKNPSHPWFNKQITFVSPSAFDSGVYYQFITYTPGGCNMRGGGLF